MLGPRHRSRKLRRLSRGRRISQKKATRSEPPTTTCQNHLGWQRASSNHTWQSEASNSCASRILWPRTPSLKSWKMPAVIYVAALVTKPDPYDTISQDIKGSFNCLRQAVKQPSVVRFVLTLSYGAAFNTFLIRVWFLMQLHGVRWLSNWRWPQHYMMTVGLGLRMRPAN